MDFTTFSADLMLKKLQDGHKGAILAGCFDSTDSMIVTGGVDSLIKCWKLTEPRHKGVIRCVSHTGHSGSVNSVDITSDGSVIVSGSDDGSVRLWSQESSFGNSIGFRAHSKSVKSVNVSGDMSYIASGGIDKVAKVWHLDQSQRMICSLTSHSNWINSVQFSACSKFLLTASDDNSVRLWDWKAKTTVASFQNHKGPVLQAQFQPLNEQQIASCDQTGGVYIYDVRNKKLMQMFDNHTAAARSVSFHPCGAFLCSASKDGTLNIYDLVERRVLYSVTSETGPLRFARFSHDGKLLLIGSDTGKFFLYDINVQKHNLPQLPDVSSIGSTSGVLREIQNENDRDSAMPTAHPEPLYSLSPPKQLTSTKSRSTQPSTGPVKTFNNICNKQPWPKPNDDSMNQVYPDLAEFLQQPAKPTRNATVEVQTDPDQTTAVSVALLNDIFEQLQLMMDTVKVLVDKQKITETNVEKMREGYQLTIADMQSRIDTLEKRISD